MAWRLNHERLQASVDRLLALVPDSGVPIPVELIAQQRGVRLRYVMYDHTLMGLHLWEDGFAVIGVNARHDSICQRFTIAHELAHIDLRHMTATHIDRGFPAPLMVGSQSSDISAQDIEASVVAAAVLIPSAHLADDMRGRRIDYLDDTEVLALAGRYQVSMQTMLFRLVQGKYIAWDT